MNRLLVCVASVGFEALLSGSWRTSKNPALADVLLQIAAEGAVAMLEGSIAQAIVKKVQGHPTNPGRLSMGDLAGYQVKKREPICSDYFAAHAAKRPRSSMAPTLVFDKFTGQIVTSVGSISGARLLLCLTG